MRTLKVIAFVIALNGLSKSTYSQTKGLPSCKKPEENKLIHLSSFTSDTLTYDQFSTCRTVTTTDQNVTSITSFKVTFIHPDNKSVFMTTSMGDSIPKSAIEQVLINRPRKVLLEEINGTSKTENLVLGHRTIYLK